MKGSVTAARLAVAGLLLFTLASCQSLREFAALQDVRFALSGVSEARLAGVDLSRVRSYSDLSPTDVLNLTTAVAQNRLPLSFKLNVRAENPAGNAVQARLVGLDWTLLLEGRETISGVLDQNVVLPPGQPQVVPVDIRLDLLDFFDDNARDLAEMALSVTGQGGAPKNVQLRAVPTIDTPVGPFRYPEPITIVSQDVGS